MSSLDEAEATIRRISLVAEHGSCVPVKEATAGRLTGVACSTYPREKNMFTAKLGANEERKHAG